MTSNNPTNPTAVAAQSFAWAEFQAGATACLRSWSALRTAVDGHWGGAESIAKADDLRDNIYRVMNGQSARPSIELEDLEDNLAIYMEEEFSVVLEDGSEKQVASTLFQLYDQCRQGNTTLAQQLVQAALQYDAQIAAAYPVCVQSTEHDDDDDDDDDDDAMIDTDAVASSSVGITVTTPTSQAQSTSITSPAALPSAAEYAAQSLFGKPKKPKAPRKPKEETPEMEMIDDDGFATVTKGRRKARS